MEEHTFTANNPTSSSLLAVVQIPISECTEESGCVPRAWESWYHQILLKGPAPLRAGPCTWRRTGSRGLEATRRENPHRVSAPRQASLDHRHKPRGPQRSDRSGNLLRPRRWPVCGGVGQRRQKRACQTEDQASEPGRIWLNGDDDAIRRGMGN